MITYDHTQSLFLILTDKNNQHTDNIVQNMNVNEHFA